ncbi:MAG TPA: DsrE family protein [Methanotrichaceae archaeon]|nr:DsrE family protein [Methanotrichaceae archaeon]
MKTLTLVLTDGPYISEYAEMAYKIASAAMKSCNVNIFLYMDALHIPKIGQSPAIFANAGKLFTELAERGVRIRACPRCGSARGYVSNGMQDYPGEIKITSLYDLQEMISCSDKVIPLTR